MVTLLDINQSVQRCTELFLEAQLLPVSWSIIIRHCLLIARQDSLRWIPGSERPNNCFRKTESNMSLYSAWEEDTSFIPTYDASKCLQALTEISWWTLPIRIYVNKHVWQHGDTYLQCYSMMKCKILDSLDMNLCHQINQFVIDNNLFTNEDITEQMIMDNIHNPFMNQYDYLYVGMYGSDTRTDKRKHIEPSSLSPNHKKSCT